MTSPKAARFRVPAALLPSLEGRAVEVVVVVVVISVVVASFERVIRVWTLFSSCNVF